MTKMKTLWIFRCAAAAVMLIVFSAVWLFISPYLRDEVGEQGAPAGSTLPLSEQARQISPGESSEYLLLINKTHGLEEDDVPADLTAVKDFVSGRNGDHQKLRATAASALDQLTADAKKDGCTIKLTSGFRSYAYQEKLYRQYSQQDGEKRAEQYSAKPGHSEHQSGLCADVSSPSVNYNLVQAYGTTREGKWLAKNAHEYGFIIRYPEGREDITGYEYEPWHIRYVGKGAAAEIYKQNITLEEYLGAV